MIIKANGKLDMASIRALTHVSLYKRKQPQKAFRSRMAALIILFFVLLAEIAMFGVNRTLLVVAVVDILIQVLDVYLYFGLPKIQYNALGKMKDAQNTYIFSSNVLKVTTKSDEYAGEAEIQYSMFAKVYETSKYFFLCQLNNHVFVVDKSTIEGGTVGDLAYLLSCYVKDKYIICKY